MTPPCREAGPGRGATRGGAARQVKEAGDTKWWGPAGLDTWKPLWGPRHGRWATWRPGGDRTRVRSRRHADAARPARRCSHGHGLPIYLSIYDLSMDGSISIYPWTAPIREPHAWLGSWTLGWDLYLRVQWSACLHHTADSGLRMHAHATRTD
jgi:hypothetical protein